MKKYILTTVFIFSFLFFFTPQETYSFATYLPFGGKVENTQYCNDGMLITISKPRGGLYFIPYQVAYRYRQYTVGLPNINVLGLALTTTYTCILGDTVEGVGFYTPLLIGSSYPSI